VFWAIGERARRRGITGIAVSADGLADFTPPPVTPPPVTPPAAQAP
jgi:hypothetical protein